MSGTNLMSGGFSAQSLVSHKKEDIEVHVDMTAMIDLVFMLNIFFMVTSLATAMAELELPTATHVTAADMENSLLISLVAKTKGDQPLIYIHKESDTELVPDTQLEERIVPAVQEAVRAGKKNVVIKAERMVPCGATARVGSAVAAAGEDVKLNFAVMEKQ